MGTSGKAEHLSNSKQKLLGSQDRRTENVSTNQKLTAAKPPISYPTPQLKNCPSPAPEPREKTRPNILLRNKPQSLAKDQG